MQVADVQAAPLVAARLPIPVHWGRLVALRDQHCQYPGRYFR